MSRVFHPVKTKFGHDRRAPRRAFALFPEPALSVATPRKLIARPVARLAGKVRAPGDKSVSHRALMFGAKQGGKNSIYLVGHDEPPADAAT